MNHSNTQQSGQIAYRTILTVSLLIGLFFFVGHLWDTYASSTTVVSKRAISSIEKVSRGVKFAKIQDIQVGKRAIGKNPEINDEERQSFLPDPDPATWRKLTLEMIKPDGKRLDITLLRPLSWIEGSRATPGTTIYLDLEELGAHGNAKVVAIDPCPPIKPGKGNVITGTFHHEAANTIDLYIDGLEKPIGTTNNHPFWSVTKQEFVEASTLLPGEYLQLHSGQTAKIVQILPRSGVKRVHNIEVMNEHVYMVTERGVAVHNQYGASGKLTPAQIGNPKVKHYEVSYEMQGKILAVEIGTIQCVTGSGNQGILPHTLVALQGVAKENKATKIEIDTMILNDRLVDIIKRTKGMSISTIDLGEGMSKHVIAIDVQ